MARYIDAELIDFSALKNDFDRARAKVIIMGQPTADVVPKSEYGEVLSSWQKIRDSYDADCIAHYKYGRAEVAREILEEIEMNVFPILGLEDGEEYVAILATDFSELKKKYTEGLK